jgi:hypothetical protein
MSKKTRALYLRAWDGVLHAVVVRLQLVRVRRRVHRAHRGDVATTGSGQVNPGCVDVPPENPLFVTLTSFFESEICEPGS